MKLITPEQQSDRLMAVSEGLSNALTWLDNSRSSAMRLDIEATNLKTKLRRCRRQADRLHATVAERTTLAFYGQSQAGKAWLISSLVGDSQQRLVSGMAGKTLDYFSHINPGNQDCGIVIRFKPQTRSENSQWPCELTLFSEADITCMVLRCGLAQPATPPDEAQMMMQLSNLQRHRQPQASAGITSDQMVSIYDFMLRHDALRQKPLSNDFWPAAIELAPWLTVDDRAQLFALLWNGDRVLTDLWRQLAHRLQSLGGCRNVLAPLSLLTDEMQLPTEALLNPASAAALNMADDSNVQIVPCPHGRAATAQNISLAELVLLTAELHIPLSLSPRAALSAAVDVLDIPAEYEPQDGAIHQDARQKNPRLADLIQAKRGYLLEYYSDRQAVNLLVVCGAASSRNQVKTVSKALEHWVRTTQGENTQQRSPHRPGLIWAITRWDRRHFQHNHDEAVQRRIGHAGDMWGSMLVPDDAGMQRMASWLETALHSEVKTSRLSQQLAELQHEVADNLLASWQYRDSENQQPEKKQHIAETLLKVLQSRTGLHGELLERLQPCRDELRRLWLRLPQAQADAHAASTLSHFSIGITFDLFSEQSDAAPQLSFTEADRDDQFAQNVLRYWVNHLRNLPENASLLALLNMDKATLQLLVEELIIASFRLRVGELLRQALTESETIAGDHNAKADRQVLRAMTVLGDFVAWLGFLQQSEAQRPQSRINRGEKIFAQPTMPAVSFGETLRLTRLSAAPANSTAVYIYDWLVGLSALIVQNSDDCAASELKPAQRQQLLEIVQLING